MIKKYHIPYLQKRGIPEGRKHKGLTNNKNKTCELKKYECNLKD